MSAQDTIHKKSFADTSVCRRGKRSTWLNGEAVLLRGSRLAAITAVSGLLASGVAIMFASVLAFSGDAMAGVIHDGGGLFTVRDVKSDGTSIDSLGAVDDLLDGTIASASETTADHSTIDFLENGGAGNFGGNVAFPNGGGDDFAIHVRGAINITSGGRVTFGVNSDDGSRLIIDGKIVINDDSVHAPQDRFGTISLKAGFHMVDFVFFEHAGGAGVELFIAKRKGTFTEFSLATFELLEAAIAADVSLCPCWNEIGLEQEIRNWVLAAAVPTPTCNKENISGKNRVDRIKITKQAGIELVAILAKNDSSEGGKHLCDLDISPVPGAMPLGIDTDKIYRACKSDIGKACRTFK